MHTDRYKVKLRVTRTLRCSKRFSALLSWVRRRLFHTEIQKNLLFYFLLVSSPSVLAPFVTTTLHYAKSVPRGRLKGADCATPKTQRRESENVNAHEPIRRPLHTLPFFYRAWGRGERGAVSQSCAVSTSSPSSTGHEGGVSEQLSANQKPTLFYSSWRREVWATLNQSEIPVRKAHVPKDVASCQDREGAGLLTDVQKTL